VKTSIKIGLPVLQLSMRNEVAPHVKDNRQMKYLPLWFGTGFRRYVRYQHNAPVTTGVLCS